MRKPRPAISTDSHVINLCCKIVTDAQPLIINSSPLPDAPEKECFQIVAGHIEKNGGEAVYGWAIWEVPGVYIEAEFHSVWRSPEGELRCLTPFPLPFETILFLPDLNRLYLGRQIDNVREPLAKDRDVYRFLYLARRVFEITNAGDLADQHGKIRLPPKAAKEYWKIQSELSKVMPRLDRRYP
ncbi:hypothetical protein [Pseudomonas sp.]|uniref:hypothetical protein n=1 Tax=Pseudomonas sp. TaxID=306 RepID=UPI003D0FBA33